MIQVVKEDSFLEKSYRDKIAPMIKEKYGITNPHSIPLIDKVIVHMRFGSDHGDKKAIEMAMSELALITGRKPAFSKARKSVSSFKLREGQMSGAFCTLRKTHMYHFLERLIYMSLPRIRDFKGFNISSFDANNSLSIGIKEHLIFNELSYDKIYKGRGLDITIVIKNSFSKEVSYDLLRAMNFPIKK